MAIGFRAQTQIATGGATNPMSAPALPAGTTTGDLVALFVIVKYGSGTGGVTITAPTSWTVVSNNENANTGLTNSGNDSGNIRAAIFFREKDAGWSTMPAVALSGVPDCTLVGAVTYTKAAGETWGTPVCANAVDNTTGSTGIDPAASATTITFAGGDWFGSFAAVNGDAGTLGTHTATVAGVTFGAANTRLSGVTTAGTDLRGHSVDMAYTSGTASAGPDGDLALTTGGANGAGLMVFYKLAVAVTAVLAAPLGGLASTVTAVVRVPAVLAAPLGSLTAAETATVTHPAVLSAPMGGLTADMAATLAHLAAMSADLGGLTAAVDIPAPPAPRVYSTGFASFAQRGDAYDSPSAQDGVPWDAVVGFAERR